MEIKSGALHFVSFVGMKIAKQSVSGALPRTAASLEVRNKPWVADSHPAKGAGRDPALFKIGLNLLQ
jgi:hypothetical protein